MLNNRHLLQAMNTIYRQQSLYILVYILTLYNPARGQQGGVETWKFERQRSALDPVYFLDKEILYEGEETLALQGGGKFYSDGRWTKTYRTEPGKYYGFRCYFKTVNVDEPNRSVLTRIKWLDRSNKTIGLIEYPQILRDTSLNGWRIVDQTYLVPAGAISAKIELHYRWDADGQVNFGGVHFDRTDKPTPRPVKVATIGYKPMHSKSSRSNLELFAGYIKKVAELKADIVCLPEGATLVGTTLNYITASEPIPGPSTNFLGAVAKNNDIYIVAGLLEKAGEVVYNTSVLIDRQGKLVGKYRKISLPREEIDGGVTPGDSLPVFDTDFGRIGMMICWDVTFPETARKLSAQGAEIILMPIWGGDVTLTRARAIENQVYVVSSSYDMVSAVFGKEGEIIKKTTKEKPYVIVDIDLAERKLWPWLGELKHRIPGEMPPKKALMD